ncbi:MAG: RNA polymerase sigma factor [Bacteroidales bacterium]
MEASKYSDHELVKRFIDGEQSSFELLIKRHKDKVYTYIFLMVKNGQLAEDIFQETFIKVIKSLHEGRYQENGKFISWVVRIAHNLIIDHFRKEKQMKMLSCDEHEKVILNSTRFSDATIEDSIIQEQITTDVRKMVDLLPDEQKEVIIMRHYLDLSFKEIADQTNVSINTALGRMRYALINLRKIMEEKKLSLTY